MRYRADIIAIKINPSMILFCNNTSASLSFLVPEQNPMQCYSSTAKLNNIADVVMMARDKAASTPISSNMLAP